MEAIKGFAVRAISAVSVALFGVVVCRCAFRLGRSRRVVTHRDGTRGVHSFSHGQAAAIDAGTANLLDTATWETT